MRKKAIPRTRRVLDAFADRIGDNTWQTVITEEGLIAVKKLLRKTVTKSTAVSCHWIRGRRRSELLWIVGIGISLIVRVWCQLIRHRKV
jgi:CRISPR-associated endonuclease/helicase Cas3